MAGFVHILPKIGVKTTQHFLECSGHKGMDMVRNNAQVGRGI